MSIRGDVATRSPLIAVLVLLAVTSGCGGGSDTEARGAVGELAAALGEPDAAALRDLVASDSFVTRTDLLTDEIVAENAFAGRSIDIDADLERFNGYGTFTLTSAEVPDVELSVGLRLTETRTPRGLRSVGVSSSQPLGTVIVNGHRAEVEASSAPGTPQFYLPPGTWTLDLPPNPFVDTEPQTVELLGARSPDDVSLVPVLNGAGRAEAVDQAEAYAAACGRATTNPRSDCGGGLTVCAGEDTVRTVTFSPEPVWTVDADRSTVTAQPGLRRTVVTACTDRTTGAVSERSRRSEPADLSATITSTTDGLEVAFP